MYMLDYSVYFRSRQQSKLTHQELTEFETNTFRVYKFKIKQINSSKNRTHIRKYACSQFIRINTMFVLIQPQCSYSR